MTARPATAAARRRRRRRPARSVIARAKASSTAERPPGYRSRHSAYSRKERPDHRELVGPSLLVPQVRGLPQLVAQERALRVLRLPAHEARPRPQQGLVDDLDAVRARLALARPRLVRREQPRGDELVEHPGRRARVGEGREKLLARRDRAGPLRRDEVAEDLAHRGDAPGADPLERRLGVPRERARDAADLVAGREGEEPALAVPLLPQPRRREGEERQRAALPLDRGQHAVEQPLLEAEPGGPRRLLERPAQGRPARGPSGVSSEKTGASASCSW